MSSGLRVGILAWLALAGCQAPPGQKRAGAEPPPDAGGDREDGTTEAGGEAAARCPDDLPPGCPADPPAFATVIEPVLASHCQPCHGPGGEESRKPLTSYSQVRALRGTVMNQIYDCRMPPAGAPPLDPDERAAVLTWLVCGAPDD